MRLGVVLATAPGAPCLSALQAQARAAEAAGLDLVWVGERASSSPLAAAAALAAVTRSITIAAAVPVGPHPLRIAEDAAVADNLTGGRLVLVLVDDDGASEDGDTTLLGETAEVVLAASAGRPFAHAGPRWRIPAHRPGNAVRETRVTVTPTPAQLELPIWLAGRIARVSAAGRRLGVTHACAGADGSQDAARAWALTEQQLGAAATKLRRVAVRPFAISTDGAIEPDELVAALRAERDAWGLDIAVLEPAAECEPLEVHARTRAVERIARLIKPRLMLDSLPEGLEEHWLATNEQEGP